MSCEEFEAVVTELARSEIMDPANRANALAHGAQCGRCQKALAEQSQLTQALREMAEQNSLQAPTRVERALLEALRDQTYARSGWRVEGRWRYWISAAAAVLLIVLGLLVWRVLSVRQRAQLAKSKEAVSGSASPDQQLSIITGGTRAPKPVSTSANQRPRSKGRSLALRRVTTNEVKRNMEEPVAVIATNAVSKEVVTDFVPVGYGNPLDLQDGGQLIRVELPRYALARFGLPMNMNRVDERVKADVLIGPDGLARAIRFVNSVNYEKRR